MTEDGQFHSAAFSPWAVREGRSLIRRARRSDRRAVIACADRVSDLLPEVGEVLENQWHFSDEEEEWEAEFLPDEFIRQLSSAVEFEPDQMGPLVETIPLRWRQDAVFFLEDVLEQATEPWGRYIRREMDWFVSSFRR